MAGCMDLASRRRLSGRLYTLTVYRPAGRWSRVAFESETWPKCYHCCFFVMAVAFPVILDSLPSFLEIGYAAKA